VTSEERQRLFRQQRKRLEKQRAARAKRELDSKPVREVSMTELCRELRAVIQRVRAGEIIVLSKHRRAVALIVPVIDESQLGARDPRAADALPALAEEFARRARARRESEFAHGRWYGKEYRRYRRRRSKPR
jgi:antitoxin (DNA-binding transcriptional repressor) of toxin-antitoxin stability system